MKNFEQISVGEETPQKDEIIALLEQILAEFDSMKLSVPAIKISEAIDCLKQR